MSTISKYLLIPVAVIVLLLLWVRFQEQFGIFHPRPASPSAVQTLPASIDFIEFDSEDGTKITGLWKSRQETAPVVVMAHGNAGNMFDRLHWFQQALPTGWNGLLFDYRGYGLSEGSPDEEGVYDDTLAAVRYARSKRPGAPLLMHGRSLGTPLMAHASMTIEPEGLILESGFPSGEAMGKTILPIPGLRYLMSVEFHTVEYLSRSRKSEPFPVFLIHGTEDRIVPLSLGKTLFEKIHPPKDHWWVSGAGHNNLFSMAGQEYPSNLTRFYREMVADSNGT